MQLLDQIVAWLVPAMCGGAVTLAAVAWRYGRAVIHGLRVLLRAEIIRIHREYVQSGRPIPVEVMDEADVRVRRVQRARRQRDGNEDARRDHGRA